MNNPKISLVIIYNNEEDTILKFLDSIFNQNYKDFELVCVNNASDDNSEKIVIEKTIDYKNVKRISLPQKVDIKNAQKNALMLCDGEFICFINSKKEIDENYISNLYTSIFSSKKEIQNFEIERMYKRELIENFDVFENLIQNKFNEKATEFNKNLEEYEKITKQNLEQIISQNVENFNNKFYDCSLKTELVEKTLWEKDYFFNQKIEELQKQIASITTVDTDKINNDIANVYNYVNEQVQKIYSDISKVYDEITHNYKYTEELVEKLKQENLTQNSTIELEKRLADLENNVIHRHVALKRLLDMQIDELNSKLKTISVEDVADAQNKFDYFETSRIIEKNLENVYNLINKNNTNFYQELTKIYQEINDKMIEQVQNQKFYFDKQINELREEFNQKIANLNK